jgi:uncharacterized protein
VKGTNTVSVPEFLFDFACIVSIVGIYPRFIEPKFVHVTKKQLHIPNLPTSLRGLRLAFISDIHCNKYLDDKFIASVHKKLQALKPHLILIGGDFLSYSELYPQQRLECFLSKLTAPLGVFACLGNHDYAQYATLSSQGKAVFETSPPEPVVQGFERLFGLISKEKAKPIQTPLPFNQKLLSLLKHHKICLLHNETIQLGTTASFINLTGLGDLTSGHCSPQTAYHNYDAHYPGIIFTHNPDAYAYLSCFPGDLFLFGHTHGGQVNIPFLWEKITPMVDTSLKSGLYHRDGRLLFVSRGLGATFPFRLFAPPQIALLTLTDQGPIAIKEPSYLFESSSSCPTLATNRIQIGENP